MQNVDIVIACSNGRNRSRLLKQHLRKKGYRSHAIGVNGKCQFAERRLKNAKVVISVHPEIEEQITEMYGIEKEKMITLDVEEMTSSFEKGKRIDGESWLEHRRAIIIPELKRQIKKHMPSLERVAKK